MRTTNGRGRDEGRPDGGRVTRRRVLVGGVAGAVALAGCSDGGTDEPTDAGAGSGDEGTESTEDEMDTETAAAEETEMAEDEETETDGSAEAASFREAVRYEESFAMTATFEQNGEATRAEGRFNGGNFYWRVEQDGQVTESYWVDGDHYLVTDGQCFLNPGQGGESGAFDPESVRSDPEDLPEVTAEGTTTIDGETMFVYEFASEAAAGVENEATYYVSAETGYLRRVEGEFGTIDYHSWGSADPVEAPDVDCESY